MILLAMTVCGLWHPQILMTTRMPNELCSAGGGDAVVEIQGRHLRKVDKEGTGEFCLSCHNSRMTKRNVHVNKMSGKDNTSLRSEM
jgi:hypothetical protein